MTPPPAVPGDEFDFEKMTPEEQLAWLESLARRQGVNEDELITAADMEIPIPENVEIDEPGYVPYSITGDSPVRPTKVVLSDSEALTESPALKAVEPAPQPEAAEDTWLTDLLEEEAEVEPAETIPALDSSTEAMRWLDELAVKAETSAIQGLASEEPGTFDWGAPDEEAVWSPETEALAAAAWDESPRDKGGEAAEDFAVETRAEGEPVAAADQDDFLGGVDPMRWLESLALRQGAKPEELLTPADLSITEPPPDVVVDEPGYVPFEAAAQTFRGEEAEATQPSATPEMVGAASVTAEPADAAESLADTQQESVSAAEVTPEAPEEFSASRLRLLAALEEHSFGDDPLSWLEKLAAEPEADLAPFLAIEEPESGEVSPVAWLRADNLEEDPLAGLTEEEIERALARGQLTPEQELAWLKRQAARLARAQETGELEAEPEPAQPATLPAWIAELQPLEEPASASDLSALLELEPEPAAEQLTDWAMEVSAELETEALADEAEIQTVSEEEPGESELQPAVPVDMPAWLLEDAEQPAQALSGEDVPDWLQEVAEEQAPGVDESWLSVAVQESESAETGADWLRALDRPIAPAPEETPAPTGPVVSAAALHVPADPEQIPVYRQRLNTVPDDHSTRLTLARALWLAGESAQSLGQYETLVEASQLLPDVIGDLIQLLQSHPREARLHRLLGDAYLRHGRLKEALHAYRRALEQL